jgi:two-component SAPR family response regulator
MSGRQLAEETLAIIPTIKVLYTTGYTPNAVVHNGVIDHGVDLLPKPFRYEQLARKIRSILDRA